MDRTYRKVLTQLPEGSQCLDDAYGAVQKIVGDFKKYVNVSKQKLHAVKVCSVTGFFPHKGQVNELI